MQTLLGNGILRLKNACEKAVPVLNSPISNHSLVSDLTPIPSPWVVDTASTQPEMKTQGSTGFPAELLAKALALALNFLSTWYQTVSTPVSLLLKFSICR